MSTPERKGRWVSLTEILQRALSFEGRTSRQGAYKSTRKQRAKNQVRNARRAARLLTRARRPEAYR